MRAGCRVSVAVVAAAVCCLLTVSAEGGKEQAAQPIPSKAGSESWQKATEGSGGIALPVVQAPVEYTFMAAEDAVMPFRDSFVVLPELEKRTNVRFKLIKVPDSNYKDKLNVVLASGDLPDFIGGVNVATANSLGPKGLFLNIWDYIGIMPNLKRAFDTYREFNDYKYSDKELYQLLDQCAPDNDPLGFGYYVQIPAVRTDILKKLNLKAPTTYDELYDMLVAMKKAYPSSYPWINRSGLNNILQQMFLGWSGKILDYTNNYATYDPTSKKYAFGPEQAGFREMIEYLARVYKEGLLDKEFAITNQQQWEERNINDKGFFSFASWNNPEYITPRAREAGNKDFMLIGFLPPIKNGISSVVVRQISNNTSAFSRKIKNPEPLLKAVDYWFYSKDGALLANAGIEGVNFVWVEKDKVYRLVDPDRARPNNETHGEKYGVRYTYMTGLRPDHFDIHNFVDDPATNISHQQQLIYKGHSTKPAPIKIFRSSEDAALMKQIGVPVNDYVAQSLTKFITGVTPMTAWDDFIQAARKMGSDRMIAVLNK